MSNSELGEQGGVKNNIMNGISYFDFKVKNKEIIEIYDSLKVIIELLIENAHHMEKFKIGSPYNDNEKNEKYINELLKSDFPKCISITYRIIDLKTNKVVITGNAINF
jgi:hypothetical protein